MVAISRSIRKFYCTLGFAIAGILCIVGVAQADSYSVNASIPYPAPTQAATVDGSPDGTTVNAALQTFTGTCQLQNPANVVSVWRNGASIGSAPCNGTYSVQVMLQPGDNILTMRTVNASMQYGPDASPFTITLMLPPDPTPPPTATPPATPSTPQNETPEQIIIATNAGAAEELIATTDDPFSVLTSNKDVTIKVSVDGGQAPYTISLDWGDGSVESHSLTQSGEYSFTHSYLKAGSYIVRGDVHDVLGASTKFMYAVVSSNPSPGASASNDGAAINHSSNPFWKFLVDHWKLLVIILGSIIFVWMGYLLGVHSTIQQSVIRKRSKRTSMNIREIKTKKDRDGR